MKILIATDAWRPQVNGVSTTYQRIIPLLEKEHDVFLIHPGMFRTIPTYYPDVRLALPPLSQLRSMIEQFDPDYIHIATEGTIGIQVKRLCSKNKWKYSTGFHTKYADYMKHHLGVPMWLGWKFLTWYHGKASSILVPTLSMKQELEDHGFQNVSEWTRGVDTTIFHPNYETYPEKDKPILMYVGRVSKEKNIEAFLDTTIQGCDKYVVGDGPTLNGLKRKYPTVRFLGMLHGQELARAYANADVFVFPSKTDTYGIVILEALACGAPVAAYPVTGPKDILTEPNIGFMHENLEVAIKQALEEGDKSACVKFGQSKSWHEVATVFLDLLILKE